MSHQVIAIVPTWIVGITEQEGERFVIDDPNEGCSESR
jgi:hypothetical protein